MGRWSADPLEDGDVRLARVRPRRVRARRHGRHEDDRPEHAPGRASPAAWTGFSTPGFKQPAGESVLIQSRTLRATDPPFTAAVARRRPAISALDVVQHVARRSLRQRGQISPDGHSALVEFEIRGDPDKAVDKVGPVLDRVDELQKAHPQLFIGEFGDASQVDALATTVTRTTSGRPGCCSLPVTLIILVIAFGALVAAGIPLLLALTAVFATFGVDRRARATSSRWRYEAGALVLLIGLAVGVDYSMFYLKREREERAAGRSEQAALEAAAATSGRSVLVSGLTVIDGDGRACS